MWCQAAPSDHLVLTCTLWLYLCFLNTQRLPVPVNGLTRLQLPIHPPPPPTPIELIHDIGGVQKKVSQNPAVLAR